FAGGFERLIFSMENENLSFGKQQTPDVFFVTLGEEAKRVGISLIAKVRKAEVSAENAPDKESLKAQMKAADKSKAKFSLILGQDELSQKKIILKNMENGQQELIEIDKFIEVIKKNIK
ncbi:MAG: histidine--tRNA ligase, partial [Candidatus Cloacimonetes bacterium]|nr:histidine--tRNA ligase [Candidatus Cloacimonadota bacterium]